MKFFASRCRRLPEIGNNAGFSLLELIIVMTLMVVVIMISAGAFERVAKISAVQTSSSDSNIQGVVGLEIMRSDLEHAGYGLPWTAPSSDMFVTDFDESLQSANSLANGINPKAFNDINNASSDPKKTPRAIQSASATGAEAWENGRDYVVIKGTSLARNPASKHWSILEGLGALSSIKQTGIASDDIAVNDRVITLKSITQDQKPYRELAGTDKIHFSYKVTSLPAAPPAGYQADTTDLFLVYGVSSSDDLKFPYNRVDYYIKRPPADRSEPGIPARCAPGTGILYKGNLRQSDQLADQFPLLDCVADMQVIYNLDTNGDGVPDLHGDESSLTAMTAEDIRNQLKEIRVYILTHEGGKDPNYNYRYSTVRVGGYGLGRDYNLAALDGIGTTWKNYRWKIYTLVVEPKNIKN